MRAGLTPLKERKKLMKEWLKNKFLPWFKAAGLRAVRTMAQTAVAAIGTTAMTLGEVSWGMVASSALLSGILSLLTSVISLPELKAQTEQTADGTNVFAQQVLRTFISSSAFVSVAHSTVTLPYLIWHSDCSARWSCYAKKSSSSRLA